jgi:Xaa-Pro dipeptidase
MITRRAVLASTVAAAAAPAASLAELKSRRSEARPISAEERLARLDKARRLMAENKIDALVLTGGSSLEYFTGVRWGLSERMFGAVIPAKGSPLYISPAFEEDRARELIDNAPEGKSAKVLVWQEDESPYTLVGRGLRESGNTAGRIGIEETVRFVFSNGIAQALPGAKIVDATPVTAGCRRTKSAAELALMKLANEVTLAAYEAAWQGVKDGMTHVEFGGLISQAHARLGFPGSAMVLVNEGAALPHGTVKPQVIREGSLVLIDGGCGVEGYRSDITRTFVVGKPSDKMKRVFELVHRAQAAALAAARPGVACEAVDAVARKIIEDGGYGPGYKYFTHRLGHGIGMDGHEWPYFVRGNKLPLEPGMTFSDEPGIYIRGEFGVRLEDCLYIGAEGAVMFTPRSPSLEQPFARS